MAVWLCLLGAAWLASADDLAWVVGIRRWVAMVPGRRAVPRKGASRHLCHPVPPPAATTAHAAVAAPAVRAVAGSCMPTQSSALRRSRPAG